MKMYPGTGLVIEKTGATVLPVRIDGAEYSKVSRLGRRLRQRSSNGCETNSANIDGTALLLDLARADRVQGALFDKPDDARSQARMRAFDKLNRRFGRDTIRYAAAGINRGWTMQRGSLSSRYTTSWDELLSVGDPHQQPGRS